MTSPFVSPGLFLPPFLYSVVVVGRAALENARLLMNTHNANHDAKSLHSFFLFPSDNLLKHAILQFIEQLGFFTKTAIFSFEERRARSLSLSRRAATQSFDM